MLTRLNLDLGSALIQLPFPVLWIRLTQQDNPLTFNWKVQPVHIPCMLMGEINEGPATSILIDVGEIMGHRFLHQQERSQACQDRIAESVLSAG